MTAPAAPAQTPHSHLGSPPNPHPGMGFKQFTALIAMLMAMNALAIDSMLPALPQMAAALGIAGENERQWIITAYLLGFGLAPLVYGVLSDRFGRKPILLIGTFLFVLASIFAGFASSFEIMLIARFSQGVGAAATRVLSVAIVRDCYSGRQMAKIMSLVFIVFMTVPILAPSVGQIIVTFAPWRYIFGVLAIFGSVILIWSSLRLPETLHPEDRLPINLTRILQALRVTLTTRMAIGYTLAMTFTMGGLFGFINSAQQIFVDIFHAGAMFPAVFALIVVFMAASSLLNSRIVERLGTRRVSHAALIGFISFAVIHAGVAIAGYETIYSFAILQALTMFCFGLIGSNFGSMAMEPLGHIAGTASSIQSTITTIGGALAGFFIGQHFDGTTVPLTLGFSLFGILALVTVLITERGRLFRPVAGG
jgi:MFS transporter, DHA1 family, multidrug resistance protein